MKRCYSLKRNKEFRYAYRVGKAAHSKSMVLIYAKGNLNEVKIGFSVSKKLGNAVVRNRIKRRLREAITPLIPDLRKGFKLIIVAKAAVIEEKMVSIRSSMRYMAKKAGLLVQGNSNAGEGNRLNQERNAKFVGIAKNVGITNNGGITNNVGNGNNVSVANNDGIGNDGGIANNVGITNNGGIANNGGIGDNGIANNNDIANNNGNISNFDITNNNGIAKASSDPAGVRQ